MDQEYEIFLNSYCQKYHKKGAPVWSKSWPKSNVVIVDCGVGARGWEGLGGDIVIRELEEVGTVEERGEKVR